MSSLIGNKPNQIPTNADLGKLAFLNALPTATTSILGGVKVDGTSIASTNGVISVGTTVSTSTLTVSSSLILPNTSSLPASPATGNLRYNTTSNKFEGYSSVGWGSIGGGGGLTPTPVKIAAYPAVANDLVRCNTSGGAFSITLPSSPADGDIVGIIDTNNSFASFNLTILPTVGKTIEGDSTSFILDVNGSYASFVYVLATVSTGNWKLQGTPLSTSPVLTASTSVLGLVKVDGTTITVNGSGVINANYVAQVQSDWNAVSGLGVVLNKPTIPAAQVQSDWNAISGLGVVLNKPTIPSAYTLTATTTTTLGGVIVPAVSTSGLNNTSGTIGLATASTTQLGGVKVDGTTITVNGSGVISASASATKTIVNTAIAYSVTATDLGKIINCTSGTFTVSLTAAATLGSGFVCSIWNNSSTATDIITIDPNGAETIDSKTSLVLQRGEGISVVCNGTNWETNDKKLMRGYAENIGPTTIRPVASGNNAIAIGQGATASGANYTIALGYGVTASGDSSTSVGSYSCTASGWKSVSIGYFTSATGTAALAIGTNVTAGIGYSTAIGISSNNAGSVTAIGGGSIALGGSYASGTDSFAAAVANNTSTYGATGANSVAIGYQNKASGSKAVSIGGGSNISSGDSSFSGGSSCTASGAFSFAVGDTSTASAYGAHAVGSYALAAQIGKYAYAIGAIATQGDAQYGLMVLRAATTTTTAVVLTSDGAAASTNNQIILPNNSVYGFTGTISAMQSAAGGTNFAIWEVKGGIRKGASAAAMTLGSYNINILSKSSGATAWTVALSADTTNGGLAITVTGAASVNIRWVASITTSEVTYA